MTITEEYFKQKFLEEFKSRTYTDDELLTEPLNGEKIYYECEDFQFFLYRFLKNNNLPVEICGSYPWTKYFQGYISYEIIQYVKRLFGKDYDKDYFKPVEPFYYETLKNHLFDCLEKLKNENQAG